MVAILVASEERICANCEQTVREEPGWFKCGCGFAFTLTVVARDPLLRLTYVTADTPRRLP